MLPWSQESVRSNLGSLLCLLCSWVRVWSTRWPQLFSTAGAQAHTHLVLTDKQQTYQVPVKVHQEAALEIHSNTDNQCVCSGLWNSTSTMARVVFIKDIGPVHFVNGEFVMEINQKSKIKNRSNSLAKEEFCIFFFISLSSAEPHSSKRVYSPKKAKCWNCHFCLFPSSNVQLMLCWATGWIHGCQAIRKLYYIIHNTGINVVLGTSWTHT